MIPVSFPNRRRILLLTILHSDDVNLYFNSQLIITLSLCCLYTGVCNKCRAEIICFSVIESFINKKNTQWSSISSDKQQHSFLKNMLSIGLTNVTCLNFCSSDQGLHLMFSNYQLAHDHSLTSNVLFQKHLIIKKIK